MKLKAHHIRGRCAAYNLDTVGTKRIMVDRLREHLTPNGSAIATESRSSDNVHAEDQNLRIEALSSMAEVLQRQQQPLHYDDEYG